MIKYKPKDYARALLEALISSPRKEDAILKNFAKILYARKDLSKWRRIMDTFEKIYNEKRGEKHIEIVLARDNARYRKEIIRAVPTKSKIAFRIDPSILGGMRALINKEILIDGSVRKRISRLFSR